MDVLITVPHADDHGLIDTIVGFLRGIGIAIREDAVPDEAFLPGLKIEAGGLIVDRTRLTWPGDLLHEAGHIAVTPAARRSQLSDDLQGHDEAPHGGEVEATAWAYAATVALKLDPSILFHDGGYRGKSPGLIMTYSLGVYPGCQGLFEAGLTLLGEAARTRGIPPYPHMIRWLRQ